MRKSKKKIAAVGITCLLASGLLLGSVEYASHTFAAAKTAESGVKPVNKNTKVNENEKRAASGVSKEESVYVLSLIHI